MAEPLDRLRRALNAPGGESSDFDLNPDFHLPPGRKLRPAGVLVAFDAGQDGHAANDPRIILTKRSSALKHHPGQIAFPGGKQDDTDTDVIAAALREAHEEIGLSPENVQVLGTLPPHETVTSFSVTPVLARVLTPFSAIPEPGEVAEVFSVPFSHLANPANYVIQSRRWRGTRRAYYTVPFGPYYVWGATARILRGLAERLSQ